MMILFINLLIIINWLKRNRQNTLKTQVQIHITLLSKSKFPANIFQIMMAIMYAFQIF